MQLLAPQMARATYVKIKNNTIGSSIESERIFKKGISLTYLNSSEISGNTIFNMADQDWESDRTGIYYESTY